MITPNSTAPDQKQLWSRFVLLVWERSGLNQKALEALLDIGDGTGQVIRSWISKRRYARDYTRQHVIKAAINAGWISPIDFESELRDLADIEIQLLQAPMSDLDLPDVGSSFRRFNATAAAAYVLELAQRHATGKISFKDAWQLDHDDLPRWKMALMKIRTLLKKEDQKVIHARLAAEYRRRGYS